MKKYIVILGLWSILVAACSNRSIQNAPVAKTQSEVATPTTELLVQYMTGTFDSYQQALQDTDYLTITLRMQPIWANRYPIADTVWLYVEQALATSQARPYRQRIYRLCQTAPLQWESTVYELPAPARFVGSAQQPEKLDRLVSDSLILREGCALKLYWVGDHFAGTTAGKECLSSLNGATYATSSAHIFADQLHSWDKGFDVEGQQVWGATSGAYKFVKRKLQPLQPYPQLPLDSTIDNYYGKSVADPYRYLENTKLPITQSFIQQQNHITDHYLNNVSYREPLENRMQHYSEIPEYSAPFRKGKYYYSYQNEGNTPRNILYRGTSFQSQTEVFLDPNTFSENDEISLAGTYFSPDNRYVAYATTIKGTDWKSLYVREVETAQKLPDTLQHIKFSNAAWWGEGFFYARYDIPPGEDYLWAANTERNIYYHRLRTSQKDDIFITKTIENISPYVFLTSDQAYLMVSYSKNGAPGNQLFYMPLAGKTPNDISENFLNDLKPINQEFEHNFNYTGSYKGNWLISTNKGNSLGKVMLINPQTTQIIHELHSPSEGEVLQQVVNIGGKLIAHYFTDVASVLKVYDDNFQEKSIALPTKGVVKQIVGGAQDSLAFFLFTSFLSPTSVYVYNIHNHTLKVSKKPTIDFPLDKYETRQVFYTSKDGTRVPMFITCSKNTVLNGQNPTLLYAYGGFNIAREPEFSPELLPFYESGGIFAVANLRGGSEYGEEWHRAGMLDKKQNVFDDFIAAAEYLINEQYTSPHRLACIGRSNGGLLIGAVLNQRPDLFAAALPVVGVMDMLRYQKFTVGSSWISEYGSSDNAEQFSYLYAYSPYHNISSSLNYPPTYIITADQDDRVVPAHSYKYAAQLQKTYKGNNPILLRVESGVGHKEGRTRQQNVRDWLDRLTFLFDQLEMYPVLK